MTPVYQVLYVSTAQTQAYSHEELDLLRTAMSHIQALGLSGYLAREGDLFFHVIEGERSVVEAVFAHIRKDRRHSKVRVLFEGMAPRRFDGWDVGYTLGSDGGLRLRKAVGGPLVEGCERTYHAVMEALGEVAGNYRRKFARADRTAAAA